MNPVLAANVASWFGPQKIINVVAMAVSNSLKRAWVDRSWKPLDMLRTIVGVTTKAGRRGQMLVRK